MGARHDEEEWLSVWASPLPPLIISQCRLTKCDICHVTYTSALQARSHFDGKNHDKKLRAALDLYCGQLGLRVTAAEFERFCNICDVELTSEAVAKIHFAGRKHVDKQLKLLSGRASTPAISDPSGRFSTSADVEAREFVIEKDEDVKKCEERGSEEGGRSPLTSKLG